MKTENDSSPIQIARKVPRNTEILLWVRAGGRCEFNGCNEYLFQHHVTLDTVKLAEIAHIVAFRPDGPRGGVGERPGDIHDISNLMLLCPRCHTLIDDAAKQGKYSRETLVKHKGAHEERIFRLTAAKPELKTSVVQLLTKIGGQPVKIPAADIWDALAPKYPADDRGCVIDLNNLDDQSDAFYSVAKDEIDRCLDRLYSPGLQVEPPKHVSVFALAPMPLLMYLGKRLSNKIPVDLYQRHRDTQNWTWKEAGPEVSYLCRHVRQGTQGARVALLLSLTDSVNGVGLDSCLDAETSVFEITLDGEEPSSGFLRKRQDLDGFRRIYHEALSTIARSHPGVSVVDVFPIVPAPIAVLCGFELFPKVSPRLRVFDRDRRRGGWSYILEVS